MTALADNDVLVITTAAVILVVVLLERRISLQIGSMHAELRRNGGSSTRDAVDRIEAKVDALAGRVDRIEADALVVVPPPDVVTQAQIVVEPPAKD